MAIHKLISEQYLLDRSIIDNNSDYKKLGFIIETVQDVHIHSLLGTNLFNEIMTQSVPVTTLTAANQTLLDDYILKIIVLYVLAEAPISFKYRYMNKNIVSQEAEGTSSASLDEVKFLNDSWTTKAQLIAARMVDYIKANQSLYPKYFNNTGIYQQTPDNPFDIDIFIPQRSQADDDFRRQYPEYGTPT